MGMGTGRSRPHPVQQVRSQFFSGSGALLSSSSSLIMKPFLSFAVLAALLYFVAEGPSPAQASPSVAEDFQHFQEKVKELADTVANKAKETFTKIQESEFSTKTRNWFKQNFQKIKDKLDTTFAK
ncbi:apolipoprotein C-I isoform X1 [Notamacropus eugenii]|uniref:apolipoprotein C-I isoform X1 n=1 Tax=Notamacropus eugenii TaxID=9315 RepID=UPI003B67E77C